MNDEVEVNAQLLELGYKLLVLLIEKVLFVIDVEVYVSHQQLGVVLHSVWHVPAQSFRFREALLR